MDAATAAHPQVATCQQLADDLRRILYGLDAILGLHFTQEDEVYSPLIDGERPV